MHAEKTVGTTVLKKVATGLNGDVKRLLIALDRS